jgi:hypothetical protein
MRGAQASRHLLCTCMPLSYRRASALSAALPQPPPLPLWHIKGWTFFALLQACGRAFGVPTEWLMGPTPIRCLEAHCRKTFTTAQVYAPLQTPAELLISCWSSRLLCTQRRLSCALPDGTCAPDMLPRHRRCRAAVFPAFDGRMMPMPIMLAANACCRPNCRPWRTTHTAPSTRHHMCSATAATGCAASSEAELTVKLQIPGNTSMRAQRV